VEDGVLSPSSIRTPPDSRPALVQPPDDLFSILLGLVPPFHCAVILLLQLTTSAPSPPPPHPSSCTNL